jgi:hypothetical protein
MSEAPNSNDVEKALRRRSRAVAVLAVVLMSLQGAVLAATEHVTLNGGRLVDKVQVGAFVFLALALMLNVLTGGRRSRKYPAMNDELVRANRARASKLGYVVTMLALIGVYVAMLLVPLDVYKYIPLLVTFGIVVPALYFSVLERKGEKGG